MRWPAMPPRRRCARCGSAPRRPHPAFTRGAVRWLANSDEQRVLSYERAGEGETLVVVVNMSSLNYAGNVAFTPGEYRDITPGRSRAPAPPPAVSLAPWEF